MRIHKVHGWNLDPAQAVLLQHRLALQISAKDSRRKIEFIAGADLAFDESAGCAYAAVVVISLPSLAVVSQHTLRTAIPFPYIPGLLSFREAPVLLQLLERIEQRIDLIFFDGQGLAHPRRLGLASHMGLFLDIPAIGCAKSRLTGTYREPANRKGAASPLRDESGEMIGQVLRTRQNCKPVFISVGNRISLTQAVEWTLRCTTSYRIPQPTRLAHQRVGEFKAECRAKETGRAVN